MKMNDLQKILLFAAVTERKMRNTRNLPTPARQQELSLRLREKRGSFLFCLDIPPQIQALLVLEDYLCRQRERLERLSIPGSERKIEALARKISLLSYRFYVWLATTIEEYPVVARKLDAVNYDPIIIHPWKVVGIPTPVFLDPD
jgi:hypothetical protein